MTAFPHLTDTESVRREAAQQYGGLNDAAAFQQAHRASMDPNVEAAALRHRNAEATAEVQNDLSVAQEKIDEKFGEDVYRVLDAAVRGEALSVVAEDTYGRPTHLVVAWTDRWRSISPKGPEAEARANAEAEAAKGRLGAEARAEVKRLVERATAEIMEHVSSLFADKSDEVVKIRDEAIKSVTADDDEDDDSGSGPVSEGSPSSTEGNDTSERSAGKTAGSETSSGSDSTSEAKWPRRHDDLDAIAADEGVEFDEGDKIDDKIAKLEAAGAKPPEE